jgi:hypothetical protein
MERSWGSRVIDHKLAVEVLGGVQELDNHFEWAFWDGNFLVPLHEFD